MGKQSCGKYEYHVNSYFTDLKKQLSLPAVFYFLQESALKHAESYNFGWKTMSENRLFWALSRIKLQIDEYPSLEDSIFVETWSKEPDMIMAHRDFEIFSSDDKKLLSATSAWLMLSMDNRKPQRIAVMKEHFPIPCNRNAIDVRLEKLPQHKIMSDDYPVNRVPYSAIDMNGHVNNTLYIQWVIDAFPVDYILNHDVCEIEVNYLHEAIADQQYYVVIEELLHDEYLCSVVKYPEAKDLSRMRLKFRKKLNPVYLM
jgi:acyl-ACP thioesterase